jgi:hypothetical protein
MKNFTQCLSWCRRDFIRYAEKAVALKFLLKFCFLFSPVFARASDPHSINKVSNGLLRSDKLFADSATITETLRTNLYLLQPDGSTILADGVFSIYNNVYLDSVTLEDAAKFTNILENLGMLRHGKTLAVERRPIIQANDTIFYKLWKTTPRAYQIEIVANMLTNEGLQAFFIDSYLNTSTPVALGDTTRINFLVNSDAGSSAVDRFKIIFKPKAVYVPTPVIFTSLNASQQGEKIAVKWQVQNETDIVKYEVEKSTNGNEFSVVNTTHVGSSNSVSGAYAWWDEKEVVGSNFYRIKSIGRDGNSKTTPMVKVVTSKLATSFIVYPNPVRDNTVNLQIVDPVYGIYQVRLLNSSGQTVYTNKMPVSNNNSLKPINLAASLPRGIYKLEIRNTDNSTEVKTILVQ